MDEKVAHAVYRAIDEVNLVLPKEKQLEKSSDTALFDVSGKLDSLGLVNLIVAVEQKIDEEFEITVTLVNEKATSKDDNPFRNIGALLNHIVSILKEQSAGQKRV